MLPIYREAAERYLHSLGITLWADWDISKPEGLQKAATWLAEQVDRVMEMEVDMLLDDDAPAPKRNGPTRTATPFSTPNCHSTTPPSPKQADSPTQVDNRT